MALTITAASAGGHGTPVAAPPPEVATPAKSSAAKGSVANVAPQAPAAATGGSNAQQKAALNRLLVTYTRDLSHGADAGVLSALGKKILSAAKVLGQHVTLPHAPASAGASSTAAAARVAAAKGKVDVTA